MHNDKERNEGTIQLTDQPYIINFMIQAIVIIIVHEIIVQGRTNKIF